MSGNTTRMTIARMTVSTFTSFVNSGTEILQRTMRNDVAG